MKIALDAMGGDFGPPNLVAGAVMALHDYKQINELYLVGDSTQVENELRKHQCNDSRIEIVHSTQVVDMSDRAWTAVRRKKDSSISRAVDLVKHGDADAVVSAGHTGAAVAAGTIKLRTLPGIDRPGNVRSLIVPAATAAPVCPALTTASASPCFTRSTARLIEESFFRRTAVHARSLISTTCVEWTISIRRSLH